MLSVVHDSLKPELSRSLKLDQKIYRISRLSNRLIRVGPFGSSCENVNDIALSENRSGRNIDQYLVVT